MKKFAKRVCSFLILVSMVISMFAGLSFNVAAITEVATNMAPSPTETNPDRLTSIPAAEMSADAKMYASYQDGSSTSTVLYTDLEEAARAYDFVNYFSGEPIAAIRTITRAYPFTPRFSEKTDIYCFKGNTYRGTISWENNYDVDITKVDEDSKLFDSRGEINEEGEFSSGVGLSYFGYFLKNGQSFSCLYTNVGQYPVNGVSTDIAVLMQVTMGDIHKCRRYVNSSVAKDFGDNSDVGYLGPILPNDQKVIGISCYYADTYNVELTFLNQNQVNEADFIQNLDENTEADLNGLNSYEVQVKGYTLINDIDGMQGVELVSGFDTVSFHQNANGGSEDGYHFVNYVSPDPDNKDSLGYIYATDSQGYSNTADEQELIDKITLGLYHSAIATYTSSSVEFCATMFKVNGKGYKEDTQKTEDTTDDIDFIMEIVPDNQYNLPFYSWNENPYNPGAGNDVYKNKEEYGYVFESNDEDKHDAATWSYDNSYYVNTGSGWLMLEDFPLTSEPEITKKVSQVAPNDSDNTITMPSDSDLFDSLSLEEASKDVVYYYVDAQLPPLVGDDTYTEFTITDRLDPMLELAVDPTQIFVYNKISGGEWTVVNNWEVSYEGNTVTAKPIELSNLVYDSIYTLVIPCKLKDAYIIDPGTIVKDYSGENTETAAPAAEDDETVETTEIIANTEPATVVTEEKAELAEKVAPKTVEETTVYAVENENTAVEAAADARSADVKATTYSYEVKFIDKKYVDAKGNNRASALQSVTSTKTFGDVAPSWSDSDGCTLLGWQAYCPEDHTWLYMTSYIDENNDEKRVPFWAKAGQELSGAFLYVIDNSQSILFASSYYGPECYEGFVNDGKLPTRPMDGKTIELYAVWGAAADKSKTVRAFEPNGGGGILSADGTYNSDPQYTVTTFTENNDGSTTQTHKNNNTYKVSRSGYTFLGWRILARRITSSTKNFEAAKNNRWHCTKKTVTGTDGNTETKFLSFYEYSSTAPASVSGRIDSLQDCYYSISKDNTSNSAVAGYMQEFYAAWAKAETNFPSFVEKDQALSESLPSDCTCEISTAGVKGIITDAIITLKVPGKEDIVVNTSVLGNQSAVTVDLNKAFNSAIIDKEGNATLEVSVKTYFNGTGTDTTILKHTFYVGEEQYTQSDFSTDPMPIEKYVTEIEQKAAESSDNGADDETGSPSAIFMVLLDCDGKNYALCGDGTELKEPEYTANQTMCFVLHEDENNNLYYTIQSVGTGKYLTLSNGSIAWADYDKEGNAGQQWHLEEADPAVQEQYYLRNGAYSDNSTYLNYTTKTENDADENEIIKYSLAAASSGEEKTVVTLCGIDRAMNRACLEYSNEGDTSKKKKSTGNIPVQKELEDYILYDYSSDISFEAKEVPYNVYSTNTSDNNGENSKGIQGTPKPGADLATTEVNLKKNQDVGTSIIEIPLSPYVDNADINSARFISKDYVPASYFYDLRYASGNSFVDLNYKAHLIPANNVHYEEDFLTYYTQNEQNVWTRIGEVTACTQNGSPKNHGYDEAYSLSTETWSKGTTYYTTVSEEENNHRAEFTFTGTGFDIISQCSEDSGTLFVRVYEITNEGDRKVGTIICDTYLADEGNNYTQIPVVHKTDYKYGTYRVVISAYYDPLFDKNYISPDASVKETKSVITEDKLREMFDIPEEEELTYICCADSMKLESENTVRSGLKNTADNTENSYNVYIDAVRVYNPLGFTNTVDGPLNPQSSNFSPESYRLYKECGALDAKFIQLRESIVLSAVDAADAEEDENSALYVACAGEYSLDTTEISGAVYLSTSGGKYNYQVASDPVEGTDFYPVLTEDGKSSLYYDDENKSISVGSGVPLYVKKSGVDDDGNNTFYPYFYYYKETDGEFLKISGYGKYLFVDNTVEARGPENEIYLPKNSVIAFKIEDFSEGQQVLISMKAIRHEIDNGNAVKVKIRNSAGTVEKEFEIKSNTEVYYNITDYVGSDGIISITASDGTASICNIQVTGCTPSDTKTATITAKGVEHFAYQALMDEQLEEHRKAGHEWDEGVVTEATCTEPSYTTYTCSVCGDTCTEAKGEALGHSWDEGIVTEATCTEPGYTTYTCSVCGETNTDAKVNPLGHDWDEGVVTLKPTQTEEGIATYTCLRCGETVTSSIPAIGEEEACQGGEGCVSSQFTDTPAPDDWAHAGIDFVLEQQLFCGVGKYTFAPNDTMTRAMLVTVLWRYEGKPTGYENKFTDVEAGQWYTDAVAWAMATGIVYGVEDNRFQPEEEITREQLATILYRYADYKKMDVAARADFSKFADSSNVSAWAETAVQWAVADGVILGSYHNGKAYLEPQGNATRAQAATILMRFIKNKAE